MRPLVIDQAEQVASAWRGPYGRLRLNTCRPFSHPPAGRFSRAPPMFASRDQLVEHLDRHAHESGIELQLGTRVERIERSDGRWALETSEDDLRARQVVVATGYEQTPILPDRAGLLRDGESPTTWWRAARTRSGCRAHATQHPAARGRRRHPGRHDGRRAA